MATSQIGSKHRKAPVLGVTRHDLISSFMIAIVIGLGLTVAWLVALWLTNRLPRTTTDVLMVEIVDNPGGYEDGAPDETLRVDQPLPETENPSVEEAVIEESSVDEIVENVIELSQTAVQQLPQVLQPGEHHEGTPGSAKGTGRRPLGSGGGSGSGRPQRWFVAFSDGATLDEYAKELDFFKIELGVLLPGKRLVYLSNLSQAAPAKREVSTGKDEDRLYMTWRGAGRSRADIDLFKKAGVDATSGVIIHFYPAETEQMLARLELEFRNKPLKSIQRTYFLVRPDGVGGYKFAVTRQTYFE